MATRYAVCNEPGCPNLSSRGRKCDECRRAAERQRGTRQARGYDAAHDHLRARYAPAVARGEVRCWRPECGRLIEPDEVWHLGHDDDDRSKYRGPEHAECNLSAAGRAAHRYG